VSINDTVKYEMSERTIVQIESPVTQSVEAVKALLSWKGRSSDPLPQFVEMGKEDSRLVLVLNNKKDAYYTVTAKACSCPSATYRPGQRCKHQRAYFPQAQATKPVSASGSIKPKLPAFRPISPLPGEKRATSSPSARVAEMVMLRQANTKGSTARSGQPAIAL
jgi:hypothetical protein